MIKPAIPVNEAERMMALQELNILDTLPEKAYDDITMLASEICDTPIALITFVDAERQFFKSARGLGISETPREYSFCAHAINAPSLIFEVGDARLDERFADNPLVTGEPRIVFYAGVPLVYEDGKALGTLCVIDISPRKLNSQQEKALQGLARQVMQLLELHKRNKELQKAQEDLRAYAEEMKQFTYRVSHDLRAPLRQVYQFLGLLQSKYAAQLDDKARQYIHYSVDAALGMTSFINDLLDYARIEHKEEARAHIDVGKLAAEVIADLKIVIESGAAEIEMHALPADVFTDRTLLRILLHNLIGNAVKYRSAERPLRIVFNTEDHPRYWKCSVADNGIGIAPEFREDIFRMFTQLHPKNEYGGNGLGLATCKKIMEKLGGEIWAESKENNGSIFYFTLPKLNT